MIIKLRSKNNYGLIHLYPACEKSGLFCELIDKKTLQDKHMKNIRELGYTISIDGDIEKILEPLNVV